MKKISVLIPCYNEEENVVPMSQAIIAELTKIGKYDYEILFIDNCSTDQTQALLTELCQGNQRIKAIFNAKNFGQFNSPYYGMLQTTGDCVISMCCDFQDPLSLIPDLVAEWEKGYRVVCAIKKTSRENPLMRFFRTCYYKLIKRMSQVEQIEHFTGTGLYDRSFIEVLRGLDDPTPFLRGIVAELGPAKRGVVYYEQQRRRAGKTHNNFFSLYDAAMLSFTSYTKFGLRIATIIGFIVGGLSFFIGLAYLILKLIFWNSFQMGMAPVTIGIFFIGAVQLFFIGLIGEYILSMNTRIMNRPLVIEEKRLNFEDGDRHENC
ncbi:MAG TPA: glycosyltransferase family 2 protein [Clostridiales bacterium]|nr:glycosyltransferase family 2 protein [Clostridiales bacterium]